MSRRQALLPAVLLLLLALPPASAGEQATAQPKPGVGDPSVSFALDDEEYVLRQVRLKSLAHLGYVLGSRGEAVVVDPMRDVEPYLGQAAALGLEVRFVLLTHTHADFVAGHMEIAARTHATILAPAASQAVFPHRPLADGDTLALGALTLEILATPGHTADAVTVLVRRGGSTSAPLLAFTGDALLVGDVGCPEAAVGETPMGLAEQAFDSLQRLALLPDETRVLPAHGGGRFCAAALEADTVSTIGRERKADPYLGIESRAAFVGLLLDRLPPAPAYHEPVAGLNRRGPARVDGDAVPVTLSAEDAALAVASGAWIVDVRAPDVYAAGHVRGSVNVPVAGPLEPWAGAVVPFGAPLLLVGDDAQTAQAARRLLRVRAEPAAGRLTVDVEAWRAGGLEVATSDLLTPEDLARRRAAGIEPLLVDVREGPEVARVRIDGSVHVPLGESARFAALFERDRPLVMICKSGYRSTMAVGLAERQGFERLANLAGGMDAWVAKGLPALGPPPDSGAADAGRSTLER